MMSNIKNSKHIYLWLWVILLLSNIDISYAESPSKDPNKDLFLQNEAKFISENEDQDVDYSLDDIDIGSLNPTKDELIVFSRNIQIKNNEEKKRWIIEKQSSINYRVDTTPKDLFMSSNPENSHLPQEISKANYDKMAFACATSGDLDCIRVLLDQEVDINSIDDQKYSLLMRAVLANQIDVIRLLLLRGANINYQNPEGTSALHLAYKEGDEDLVNSLLAMGSSNILKDKFGKIPQDYLVQKSNISKND